MGSKCSSCSRGPYTGLSDYCDGCRSDPDVGWGSGSTDHSLDDDGDEDEDT